MYVLYGTELNKSAEYQAAMSKKRTLGFVRPAKNQISLDICAV